MNITRIFISGMLTMGYLVATVFFTKFWWQSRDRLFLLFAAAFGLLAVQRFALIFATDLLGDSWTFLIRLAAFLVILYAIVAKNRER